MPTARKWTRASESLRGITQVVRDKMDLQYRTDIKQMKEVGSCFKKARHLYDRVVAVERVRFLIMHESYNMTHTLNIYQPM